MALEPVNSRDAVADFEHRADLVELQIYVEGLDLLSDDRADFVGPDFHVVSLGQ